ncbi:MAG: TonB-dependent receptor [Flavobacteriaceae bacterium]|jgi:hypothetical protein|nr:TonB-dependent receptor [Flavobacteriaceae bacterium]
MKSFFSFLFLVFWFVSGYSQSKITVNFNVTDERFSCIDTIQKNILLQHKRDDGYNDIESSVSSECSYSYTFSKVPGNFRILITTPGYEIQTLNFDVTEQTKDILYLGSITLSEGNNTTDINAPASGVTEQTQDRLHSGDDITLSGGNNTDDVNAPASSGEEEEKEKEIDGVMVTGMREKYVKFEANKTTYTVKDNDILSGGSTEDALTKIPGVIKGYGGEITVNGKSMAIYIDDSPTGLSSSDLENLLQSIPANSIEKIEIIANPGASYEANTGGGIINIVTNGRALGGLNGSVTLNYRFNENNRVAPSVNLNTRIKNVGVQLNSGFNYRERERTNIYNREFTSFSPSIFFTQTDNEKRYNRYYFFRPSVNIRLNDKSSLVINYNLNLTHNNSYNKGESTSTNNIGLINLLNDSKSVDDNFNQEITTKYKIKLDSLGKTFDITAYYSYFDKNITGQSTQNNQGIIRYSLNDIDSKYDNFYAKTNIEIPSKKWDLSLNIGGKYSVSSSSSSGKYNLLNDYPISPDSPEYNSYMDFDYDEHQYALYTEINKNIKNLSITAGLRYENLIYKSYVKQTDQKIKHALDKLYPSFSLLYKLSPVVNINASYRKSISLPSYTNLDPNITGYLDEYNTSTGNPYLQPDYYDNYEVAFSAFNYLRLSFQYTYSKYSNLLYFETEDNSLKVNQTTVTFNRMNNYNISLGVPVPLKLLTKGKKFFDEPMNIDRMSFIYFYGMYNFYKLSDYPYVDSVKPIWFYAFYSQIALPANFKLTAFYMFSSDKGYFRIYKANKPFNYSNIELSRPFYDKALKISFGADNLFNTSYFDAGIINHNLNTNFYQQDNNRLFYFKLSYNFGKLRNIKKENTLIEEENKQNNNRLVPAAPIK